MNSFDINDEKLLDCYNLKTLDPSESWEQDSSLLINLDRWQDISPNEDNSYDILKDLLIQQQNTNALETALSLNDASLNHVRDPLNNERMLPLLDKLGISEHTRLKYLINSKTFDVKAFLRDVHNTDSFEDLSYSLDILDKTLQEQSQDLNELVQANFTKYVRIKNRLDQIYEQFSEKSNSFTDGDDTKQLDVDRLGERVDESIRVTTLKLKPLLKSSQKLKSYEFTKKFIEENKDYFNLPHILRTLLDKNDYPNLMFEYSGAKDIHSKLKDEYTVKNSSDENNTEQVPKIIAKIWVEVEKIIDNYRQHTWRSLITPTKDEAQQNFLPLISKLLDLNVKESPIMAWIRTRLDHFEAQLNEISSQMLPKIIQSQRKIIQNGIDSNDDSNSAIVDGVDLSHYLYINQLSQGSESSNQFATLSGIQTLTDSTLIVETWLIFLKYLKSLEDVCMKFIEVWEHVQNFLTGAYQTSLLNDKKKDDILIGSDAMKNHKGSLQLEEAQVNEIRSRGEHFVSLLYTKLLAFFKPSQDELLQGKLLEEENGSSSNVYKETGSPSDYGFVPLRANGLSCLRYLPKMIEPLLKYITELAQLGISSKILDSSKRVASIITDRCIGAIASTKLRDISNFYKLEDWTVYETVKGTESSFTEYGVTQFPEIVLSYQESSIRVVRDLLFAFERLPAFNGISVVGYPSRQALTAVELQQLISMEAILEAVLKNAAKDKYNPRNSHTVLTLTNLQYIREVTFPQILQVFDDAFEWNLKGKNLELFSLLFKMESSIFGNYLSDLKVNIRDVLEVKFNEVQWATYSSNSFRAGDYTIDVLMLLVTIHSECFRIGPQLIHRILREAQIFISKFLFESFKPFIGNLPSDGLLQATVDLQFFQRVLGRLLEKDTEVTLTACLQNCFQNNIERMQRCIKETEPIVSANLARTSIQFAAFK